MRQNILVLGSNGFIGSKLLVKLSKIPNVTIVGYGKSQPINIDYPFISGNFIHENNWESILNEYNINAVIHLVSTSFPNGNLSLHEDIENNVLPTIKLLDAIVKKGTCKIVFVSSGGCVYGEYQGKPLTELDHLFPINAYGFQKMTIENCLSTYNRTLGLEYTVARVGNPYGMFTSKGRTQGLIPILFDRLLNNNPITIYGNCIRDYIYIDDLVDIMVKILFYKGEHRVFNVGTGFGTSTKELITLIEDITQRSFSKIDYLPRRNFDVNKNILDISLIENEFNWFPKFTLPKGLSKIWHQINYY